MALEQLGILITKKKSLIHPLTMAYKKINFKCIKEPKCKI